MCRSSMCRLYGLQATHPSRAASARFTDEDWTPVPNGSVFHADDTGTLPLESLERT